MLIFRQKAHKHLQANKLVSLTMNSKAHTTSKPITHLPGMYLMGNQMGYYRMSNKLLNKKWLPKVQSIKLVWAFFLS